MCELLLLLLLLLLALCLLLVRELESSGLSECEQVASREHSAANARDGRECWCKWMCVAQSPKGHAR